MASKPISMLQARRIIQLLDKECKIRSIARELGISRNTVKNYLPVIANSGMSCKELLALSNEELSAIIFEPQRTALNAEKRFRDLSSHMPMIEEQLGRTGVTRELLWQEYRMIYPDGYGYTQFCHHIAEHFKHKDTVMHFVHKPGEKMLVDFAGHTMSFFDEEGIEVKCQVFIAILPFSGYTYVEAVQSQKQGDFIRCLENALIFFGGVPGCIISDNLKSCIKSPDRYEPELTELLNQFSLHYNTTVSATRVAKPRDKASVEKAVHLAYQRVYAPLRNRIFESLGCLNSAIAEQNAGHNLRRFRQSEESRKVIFDSEEKNLLAALPSARMEMHRTTRAKVQHNYHIVLGEDWHYYSVPYQYVGKEVKVIYTHSAVEIYHEHKRIAVHQRNVRRNNYTTLRDHMPSNHQHYDKIKGWNAEYFRQKAASLSEDIAKTIEHILQSRFFYEQTYNACIGILRLGDKYSVERLSTACAMALKANAVTYRFINNILRNNMDLLPSGSVVQTSLPLHENVRGAEAYQ